MRGSGQGFRWTVARAWFSDPLPGGDGYLPGERGSGTVESVDRGEWTGTRLTRRYALMFDHGSRLHPVGDQG